MTVGDQGFQLGVSDGIYSAGTLPIGTSLPVNTTYSEAVRIVNIEGAPGCLAFGVTAERPAGSSSPTTPYFVSDDDCTGTRVTMTMDATWQSKYARVLSGGRLEYIAQTVSCGTLCRWVLLYNFSAAAWDAVLIHNGGGSDAFYKYAVSIYDTINMLSCPTVPSLSMDSMLTLIGSTWYGSNFQTATPYNGTDYCFTSGAWTVGIGASLNTWVGQTPNP